MCGQYNLQGDEPRWHLTLWLAEKDWLMEEAMYLCSVTFNMCIVKDGKDVEMLQMEMNWLFTFSDLIEQSALFSKHTHTIAMIQSQVSIHPSLLNDIPIPQHITISLSKPPVYHITMCVGVDYPPLFTPNVIFSLYTKAILTFSTRVWVSTAADDRSNFFFKIFQNSSFLHHFWIQQRKMYSYEYKQTSHRLSSSGDCIIDIWESFAKI